MIYVVRQSDNKILFRYDAWLLYGYDKALADLKAAGYTYLREEISFMGDMHIYVQ